MTHRRHSESLVSDSGRQDGTPGLPQERKFKRFYQLDALRGLAAITVVIQHCLYVFPLLYDDTLEKPGLWLLNLFKYSPLHLFWAGSQAVFLFFLLSGFVLSLPFYTAQASSYPAFLVRRICRLYLPYVAALAAAVFLDVSTSRHGIATLSGWFNSVWGEEPSTALVFQHALLIDHFDTTKINPVIWSLVQEMRISLLFPLLMWLINRYHLLFIGALGLVLYSVGEIAHPLYDGATTLEVLAFFILGALLAKYRTLLLSLYQRLPPWAHYLIFVCALLCYTGPWWMYPIKPLQTLPLVTDFVCVVGGSALMMLALASNRLSRILCLPPLLFLGRISFSVYLYHIIILVAAINLLYGSLNIWLILFGVLLLTLVISSAAYYGIEKPAIALGHRLTKKGRLWSHPRERKRSQQWPPEHVQAQQT